MLRDSLEAGTFEDTFFTVPAKGETDTLIHRGRKLLDRARRLRREAREGRSLSVSERKVAKLTPAAIRVLEELCTIARLCAGKVYPSYEHLADATALGRGTVARVLNILDDVGLLVRQRRFAKIKADAGTPRYQQTSNAYRLTFPANLLGYLPRWLKPAPLPDDETQRAVDRQVDQAHMLSQLNSQDLARAIVGGGPLADVLAKLGSSIDAQTASTVTVPNR